MVWVESHDKTKHSNISNLKPASDKEIEQWILYISSV